MIVGKEQPIKAVVTTIHQLLKSRSIALPHWFSSSPYGLNNFCRVEVDMFNLCIYDNM